MIVEGLVLAVQIIHPYYFRNFIISEMGTRLYAANQMLRDEQGINSKHDFENFLVILINLTCKFK
jgi:hypothetical protein